MDNGFQCRQITLGSTNSGTLEGKIAPVIPTHTALPHGKLQVPIFSYVAYKNECSLDLV